MIAQRLAALLMVLETLIHLLTSIGQAIDTLRSESLPKNSKFDFEIS